MPERHRFDVIDQEQLAAQVVAIMDAHFQRPSRTEKLHILKLASQQLGSSLDEVGFSQEVRRPTLVHLVMPS
jgi:hypothetical protein